MEDRLHYLFKRYLDNTCSQKELEEFFSYVHKAEHDETLRQLIKKVYTELKDSGSNITYVDENGRLVLNEPAWMTTAEPEPAIKRPKPYAKYLIAALFIIAVGAVWMIQATSRAKNQTQQLSSLTKKTTNRSESKFLLLEDSTQVWLNAASSLEFPDQFDSKKREVFLTGEAFFDVKHTDKIPFIIHTGNVSTTVLGTAFNIKAYPGQENITISVSRGKVRVSRKDGWETTLTKGQQVKLRGDGQEAYEKSIPAEMIAGWQQGNLVYDDETLVDIIGDMQRIYNAEIHINNQQVANLKISTSFKREIGIEQALQVLCRLTDTELTKKEGIYIIQ
jgi:ferric-dicitrate binding protein FerR (iron transport regulator)